MSVNKVYSGIRVRKSIQNHKNKNNLLFLNHVQSNELKKQLTSKLNQEPLNLPTFKTQLMITTKKIHIPTLVTNSGRNHFSTHREPPRGKTVTGIKGKTAHFESCRYLNEKQPSLRCRKVSYGLSPLKGSYSSVLTPKSQPYRSDKIQSFQNLQEFKENDTCEINLQSTNFFGNKSIRKPRDQKCLLAATRKLPFSLEKRKTKVKFTEKTNFTTTVQDLFDLDISTIMDEHEPDTPFLRRGSQLDSIINIV